LTNHFKDQEEDWKKQELLCRFINPQIASVIFDKKDVEKTESTPDVFFDNVAKDLKGKYTPEELKSMLEDPKHWESLDRIEKA
jgi:hypothetical protein